jgi:hypothetical protein
VRSGTRILIVLVACGLETSCASFLRGPLVFWSCGSEATVAGVKGSAYYNLDPKGRPSQEGGDWEWHASDRDFRVSLMQWPTDDEVMLVADMPNSFFRNHVATEVRFGSIDRQQLDSTLMDRSSEALQHHVRLSRPKLSQLAASGTPVYVVAVDRSGNVIRSLRLETTAVANGEAAMASARERAAAKTRDYRALCAPIYQSTLDVLIA